MLEAREVSNFDSKCCRRQLRDATQCLQPFDNCAQNRRCRLDGVIDGLLETLGYTSSKNMIEFTKVHPPLRGLPQGLKHHTTAIQRKIYVFFFFFCFFFFFFFLLADSSSCMHLASSKPC